MVLFHSAIPNISEHGAVACASCHLDGRTDGLSWQIEGKQLQTRCSPASASRRLPCSSQISSRSPRSARRPAIPRKVARGKQLFDPDDLGCRGCHDGPLYTDRERHELASNLKHTDTPSLLGLAASPPYFHDGSAATLEALLRERGAVHGMAMSTQLTDAQIADLTAFLETLSLPAVHARSACRAATHRRGALPSDSPRRGPTHGQDYPDAGRASTLSRR